MIRDLEHASQNGAIHPAMKESFAEARMKLAREGLTCLLVLSLAAGIVGRPRPLYAKNEESVEGITVPLDLQYQLLLKILTFDRNLKKRAGNEIVLGIAYESGYQESLKTKDALLKAASELGNQKVGDLPVRFVPIGVKEEGGLAAQLQKEHVNILYVAPMGNLDVGVIASVCQAMRIMSLTGVPSYIERGISFGFDLQGGKLGIIVNLPSAKAEGTDFSSKLLRLVRVVEGKSR